MNAPAPRGGNRPAHHRTVHPFLIVEDVDRTVGFLVRVFEAIAESRFAHPDGRVLHAEVRIDDSLVLITAAKRDAAPMPCSLGIYADDVDATYERALASGARSLQAPADQLYGHRTARVEDPAGNQWTIHTVIERVSATDIYERSAAVLRKKSN